MIEMLPINHTIFVELVEKDIEECKQQGRTPEITDAEQYLFSEFERAQK